LVEEADPEQTARREAYERAACGWENFSTWTSLGISKEMMDLYLAPYSEGDRVDGGGGLASEQEPIEVTELSLDRLWSMVEGKESDDLKTLTLVLALRTRHPDLFGAMEER